LLAPGDAQLAAEARFLDDHPGDLADALAIGGSRGIGELLDQLALLLGREGL
jgi:hypothetical protein